MLAISKPVVDQYCESSCWCQSLALVFQPVPCILRNTRQCKIDDGVAFDAETGEIVGNVSQAKTLADGTLDFSATLQSRDTDHSHDIVDTTSALADRDIDLTTVRPVPKTCILLPFTIVECFTKAGVVYSNNGTVLGNLEDAYAFNDGTLDFSQAAIAHRNLELAIVEDTTLEPLEVAGAITSRNLAKRNNYALNCGSRQNTVDCQSHDFGYFCTNTGRLGAAGAWINPWCLQHCSCVNLSPYPKCILGLYKVPCYPPGPPGSIQHNPNGTSIGNLTDAGTVENGTLDLEPVIESRDLSKRNNYALVCVTKPETIECISFGWVCSTTGKLQSKNDGVFVWYRNNCRCVNLSPAPKPACIVSPFIIVGCSPPDSITHIVNHTTIGNLTEADVPDNVAVDDSPAIESRGLDLVKRNNYAMDCKTRSVTAECASFGWFCNSAGRLASQDGGFFIWCREQCRCVNLSPAPKCIVWPYSVGCSPPSGIIHDVNGTAVGNLTGAGVPDNVTVDDSPAIESRGLDLVKRNNYAINCNDRELTYQCQAIHLGYYCNSNGQVQNTGNFINTWCNANCQCVRLTPFPKCILGLYVPNCKIWAGIAYLDNGTALGNVTDAYVDDNGDLDFTPSPAIQRRDLALAKRNNFALVCGGRDPTSLCQQAYGYYCTETGRLSRTGSLSGFCNVHCRCVNLRGPNPKCIPYPYVVTGCYINAEEDTAHYLNGTLLGQVSDAHIYDNGTLDFTSLTIESRSPPLVERHDYALVCDDRDGTALCGAAPWRYTCDSSGKLSSGAVYSYCEKECRCQNLYPANYYECIVLPYVVVSCDIYSGVLHNTNTGAALGHVKNAEILPNGTYDLTKALAGRDEMKAKSTTAATLSWVTYTTLLSPSATPSSFTIQDIIFGCENSKGVFDNTITNWCKDNGYSCAMVEGPYPSPVYQMNTPLWPSSACDAGCMCAGHRQMLAARDEMKKTIPVVTKVSATPPATTTSNTLDFSTPTGVVI